tara:strand:- start:35211 stop:37148 length:1938 start_codon:yes stop_codon:yes gene_type:complete
MSKVYVFDLEANGLLDKATKVHCGVVSNLKGEEVWAYRPHQIDQLLVKLREADVLICHNLIDYDLPLLEKLYGFKYEGKVVDTLIMSRLHKPDRRLPPHAKNKRAGPHGLYAWGCRVGVDKPDYDEWDEFDEAMLHRCIEDVKINKLVFFELMKEIKGQNWRNAHLLSFELFKNLKKQEQYGWLVDQEYMEKSIKLLTHWMDRIDATIVPLLPLKLIVDEQKVKGEYKYVSKPFKKNREYTAQVLKWMADCDISPAERHVVGPFSRISYRLVNLNSNEETKDYLLSEGWQPDAWNYKKDERGRPIKGDDGKPIRTSPKLSGDDPFLGVNGGVGRLIAKRVQARHRRSQIEGWLKNVREDGRLPAGISGVAATGRMKHKTLVNVPGGDSFFGKQMRKCFIAKPGYVLVGCDSAGCQNRQLAARVGDPFFTETLINGSKEDGTSIHHVNQRAIKEVAGLDVSYHLAKTLNYAFMFGASDRKLASTYGSTSVELGAKIREALLSVAAGFEALVNNLTKEWQSNARKKMNAWGKMEYYHGWCTGLDGRPIYIESEHQILVYMLQSDEGIMMSAAYNLLWKRLSKKYKYGEDFGVVCFMHDEYTIECREEIAEDVKAIAEQCIVDAGKFYKIACPHEGEGKVGRNWWEIH